MTVIGLENVSNGQSVRGGLTANNVKNKLKSNHITDLDRP
jgi:hypothetical protein